jgi:hypothetical protein
MTEVRPYPNVVATKSGRRWTAWYPMSGGTAKFLGNFTSPEIARANVLEAQAKHLSEKAQMYRAEAAMLRGRAAL